MYRARHPALHGHHQTHIGGRTQALGANIHAGLVTVKPVVEQLGRRLCGRSKGRNADLGTDTISTTEVGTGTVTVEAAVHEFGKHGGSLVVKEGRRRRR